MLSKIKVYGRLAKFLGERTFEAEVKTPIDTFKFLLANFPNLERHMMEQNYCVKVGKNEIDETQLFDPMGKQEIKIVPVAVGARRLGRVLAGVALIGAAILLPGAAPALTAGGFVAGSAGASALTVALGNLGLYFALSGAAQMLSPVQNDTTTDDPNSFNFNGILNTINAGSAIPVVYGEVFTGSIIVSAGIDTEDFSGGT